MEICTSHRLSTPSISFSVDPWSFLYFFFLYHPFRGQPTTSYPSYHIRGQSAFGWREAGGKPGTFKTTVWCTSNEPPQLPAEPLPPLYVTTSPIFLLVHFGYSCIFVCLPSSCFQHPQCDHSPLMSLSSKGTTSMTHLSQNFSFISSHTSNPFTNWPLDLN